MGRFFMYRGICTAILVIMSLGGEAYADLRMNPDHIKGPDACGECHKKSVESWKQSHHAKSFKTLPRSENARDIAKKMGLKRIKADSDCLTCHFTSAMVEEKIKPIAGISCESCHGAGMEWIDVHSDFGGKDVKAENEDPAHKVERYSKSEAAGMIRPSNIYALAENCYQCHTVPNEKLVNIGGHTAGSAFELVRWSQGEVRHNLWYTDANEGASIERRRMMFIVGKALDLEYALRGVAKATEPKKYAKAMAKRAATARKQIAAIAKRVESPEIDEIVAISSGVKLKLNNEAELSAAALAISNATKALAKRYDGSEFGGIDGALPSEDKYKGLVNP
jgi:hypothetical protein